MFTHPTAQSTSLSSGQRGTKRKGLQEDTWPGEQRLVIMELLGKHEKGESSQGTFLPSSLLKRK